MIILNSDYELPFVFFDKLDKIEPLKMDDETYTKRCFYYRDKDKRVLVRINKDTIKNIELVSNDSKTNIHSYTNSGAGSAILGGLIAGDEGFATGALLGRETKIYGTHEAKYTILITLKNSKAILIQCDDQEKNELFFLKSKLTDKEVEVEETKIFSEIEKDFWKLIDKRNKMHRKINYYNENCYIRTRRTVCFWGTILFFLFSMCFVKLDASKIAMFCFLISIFYFISYFAFNRKINNVEELTKKINLEFCLSKMLNFNYFGLEFYFTKLLCNK